MKLLDHLNLIILSLSKTNIYCLRYYSEYAFLQLISPLHTKVSESLIMENETKVNASLYMLNKLSDRIISFFFFPTSFSKVSGSLGFILFCSFPRLNWPWDFDSPTTALVLEGVTDDVTAKRESKFGSLRRVGLLTYYLMTHSSNPCALIIYFLLIVTSFLLWESRYIYWFIASRSVTQFNLNSKISKLIIGKFSMLDQNKKFTLIKFILFRNSMKCYITAVIQHTILIT